MIWHVIAVNGLWVVVEDRTAVEEAATYSDGHVPHLACSDRKYLLWSTIVVQNAYDIAEFMLLKCLQGMRRKRLQS